MALKDLKATDNASDDVETPRMSEDSDKVMIGNGDETMEKLNDARASQARELADQITDNLVQKLKHINKKRKYVANQSAEHLRKEQPIFAFFAECIK